MYFRGGNMKKIIILGMFLAMNAYGAERVLLSDFKDAAVTLNESSVRCSAFGYGMAELKVNIKALDGWTLFDHSNVRQGDFRGQPCMTAGACRPFGDPGFSVEDILGTSSRTENIRVFRKIVEVKNRSKNEAGNDICLRHIEERLLTQVNRGDFKGKIQFNHVRSGIEEVFPISICQ